LQEEMAPAVVASSPVKKRHPPPRFTDSSSGSSKNLQISASVMSAT
jgi:hypothetical protein